jgi:hypothetical protein
LVEENLPALYLPGAVLLGPVLLLLGLLGVVCGQVYIVPATITNEKISEDVFNGEEEGVAKFQHNDKRMDDIRVEYYQLVEDSDDKLEAVTPDDTSKEDKVNLESDLKQKQEKKLLLFKIKLKC